MCNNGTSIWSPGICCRLINIPLTFTYTSCLHQELGNDNSVLQAFYAQNRTLKATNPSHIHRTPSVNLPPLPPPQEISEHTIHSYPAQWREVISYVKQSFRAYIAGQYGFPHSMKGVDETRQCLEDALAVHIKGGVQLNQVSWTDISVHYLTIPTGHEINKDMIMLVSLPNHTPSLPH